MPDIGPRIALKSLSGHFLPSRPVKNSGFKGKLLTPDDGCGVSKESAHKIVGGSPAKPGQYPWMALLGSVHSFFSLALFQISYIRFLYSLVISSVQSMEHKTSHSTAVALW